MLLDMKNSILVVLCGILSAAVALPATNNNAQDEKAVMATLEAMAQASIKKDIAAGMTQDQVVASKPTADFDAAWGGGFLKPDAFTTLVYSVLKP